MSKTEASTVDRSGHPRPGLHEGNKAKAGDSLKTTPHSFMDMLMAAPPAPRVICKVASTDFAK